MKERNPRTSGSWWGLEQSPNVPGERISMLETMKAAIFDMDGTLLDSMTKWRELNGAFVRQMGITPTEKQEADMMSMSGTMVVD